MWAFPHFPAGHVKSLLQYSYVPSMPMWPCGLWVYWRRLAVEYCSVMDWVKTSQGTICNFSAVHNARADLFGTINANCWSCDCTSIFTRNPIFSVYPAPAFRCRYATAHCRWHSTVYSVCNVYKDLHLLRAVGADTDVVQNWRFLAPSVLPLAAIVYSWVPKFCWHKAVFS